MVDESEVDPDSTADSSEADPDGGEVDSDVAIDCTNTLQAVTSIDKSYRYSTSAGD